MLSKENTNFRELNAKLNLLTNDGKIDFQSDKEATRQYFLNDINQNTVFFHSLEEKVNYLIENEYYEKELFDNYSFEFVKNLFKYAYSFKFRFETFMGACKFYTQYALKTFDGSRYIERYEDRVCMNALLLAQGNENLAMKIVKAIIKGEFQPATPTFLNAGKKQRGEYVSCFLLNMSDDMESIGRTINSALQLSKRGGGVAINISNLREMGAPIKKIENQSSGVIPVMKILEDSFSYANQLGSRQGAGVVYLNVFHKDILRFLDTKRENADEKIRIKTLSLGVVIPDKMFELAKDNEDMFLFSPYEIENEYGVPFTEISITEKYDELVNNPNISKTRLNPRKLLSTIAEIQFESGYPYILFEDTANKTNPIAGRINMSNLCSEILQVSELPVFNPDLSYKKLGKDISCNLGSLNIAKTMDSDNFEETVETAIRSLSAVSEISNLECVPSIKNGNDKSHAIGLGQMNLHGFLAREKIFYGSEECLDFVDTYFKTILYYALKASNKIAKETGKIFEGFEKSTYAFKGIDIDKNYFVKIGLVSGYEIEKIRLGTATTIDYRFSSENDKSLPKTEKVRKLFENINIPKSHDWAVLAVDIFKYGLHNQNLQAVPPTGSISYINNSTASIHPIPAKIEIRKEGKLGRVYYPAPYMTNDNLAYYQDAFEIGYEKIIDVYATAQKYIDQGMSLTLFFNDSVTTREVNKAQIYAWRKGIKTLYYIRLRQEALKGADYKNSCVSCML